MTSRVSKSVSLPTVRARPREPLTLGRGEYRVKDDGNPRPRSAPSSPDAGRKLLASRKKSTHKRLRYISGSGRRQQTSRQRQAGVSSANANGRQRHSSIAPGYVLSRTPTNVLMNINTASFFGDETKDTVPSQKNTTTGQVIPPDVSKSVLRSLEESVQMQQSLQRDIAEMSLQMDQQTEDYQQHIQELQEEFDKEKKSITKAYEIDLSDQQERHKRELKILHDRHAEELRLLRSELAGETSGIRGELEFTKELLERTRAELVSEAEEILQEREQELSELHSDELQQLEHSLRSEAESNLSQLRASLEREREEREEEQTRMHKMEVEGLLSQFSNVAKLEDELAQSRKQIKKLESEITELQEEAREANSLQVNTEARLLETQRHLEAFERDFQDKVHAVEDHHRSRIDTLLHENTELRHRLILKTEQFSQYRTSIEKAQRRKLNSFKEKVKVVVQARSTADLGVAVGLDWSDGQHSNVVHRPLSAPTTPVESDRARGSARSTAVPVGIEVFRPQSCYAQLNRQSLRKH